MVKSIRSIYSQNPGIRLEKLRVRRVRLNRHLPEAQWIADHRHAFCQILLYLSGSGSQRVAGREYPVEKGLVFFIPPGVRHSFREPAGTKPLCLALDLDFTPARAPDIAIRHLSSLDLSRVRQALSGLTRWRTGQEEIRPGEAAEVLRLIDILFHELNFLRKRLAGPEQNVIYRAVQRVLYKPSAFRQSLHEIAREVGYHPDYLNRTLKGVCGLTLGEMRNEVRVQKSKRLLAVAKSVAQAAEEAGFDDPNYFARWFREQTGRTPTSWRAGRLPAAG